MKLLTSIVLFNNDQDVKKITGILDSQKKDIEAIYIKRSENLEDLEFLSQLNQAISNVKSSYVQIIDASYLIEEKEYSDILGNLQKSLSKKKLFFFMPYRLNDKGRRIQFFNCDKTQYTGRDNLINIHLSSYIAPSEYFDQIKIRNDIDWDHLLVFELIRRAKKYFFLGISVRTLEYPEWDFYNFPKMYYHDWYGKSLDTYNELLSEHEKSRFAKLYVTYLIELKFSANRNNRNKGILGQDETSEFINKVSNVYKKIPNDILMRHNLNGKRVFPKYMCWNNIKIKEKNNALRPNIVSSSSMLIGYYNQQIIEHDKNIAAEVLAINYDKRQKTLNIDFEIRNGYCLDENKLQCYAKCNKKEITAQKIRIYSKDKYFGRSFKEGLLYSISIPESSFEKRANISLIIKYGLYEKQLPLFFIKTAARLSNFNGAYWKFGRYILSYNSEKNYMTIKMSNLILSITSEAKFLLGLKDLQILKEGKPIPKIEKIGTLVQAYFLRVLYFLTKPLYAKRNIWITFDQLFKGGDNGEYIFKYIKEHNREIDIRYIANKDSADAIKLRKKYRGVLSYKSLLAKIISMHANLVLATRVDVKQYLGFSNVIDPCVRNLLNYEVICLQHGLSIQEIAEYQNRLFDNTKLYLCASEFEVKNLMQEEYGYSRDALKIVGLARYDGLVKKDDKFILISPTWRRNVTAGTNRKGEKHLYSENFKHSVYFKVYNSLINDGKLIDAAKKYGYKIVYLLHPILSVQIDDFDKNENVEIIAGANNNINYEDLLSRASLMVTDHSGIMYDFSYMRKPIVYYHPEELPAQYTAKTMSYADMGFGPVCISQSELVDNIIYLMQNECRIEVMYKERADKFFAFNDHKNCERIVETVKEYQKLI